MNYIISSIILLVITIIIIYLLSIDNNIDKFKNKFNETFSTLKSTKINYLNEQDTNILLYFLKSYFQQYDNIMIPKKVFYTNDKNNTGYIMEDIEIIGYTFNNNTFNENKHKITVKFILVKNELFIGRYTLFGQNGNYYIEVDNNLSHTIGITELIPIDKPIAKPIDKPIAKPITKPITKPIKGILVEPRKKNVLIKQETFSEPRQDTSNNSFLIEPRQDTSNNSVFIKPRKNTSNNSVFIDRQDMNTTDIFDMIPDIIHLSSNVEEDSDILTTATPRKNQRA